VLVSNLSHTQPGTRARRVAPGFDTLEKFLGSIKSVNKDAGPGPGHIYIHIQVLLITVTADYEPKPVDL
jgi:hypothetical protein